MTASGASIKRMVGDDPEGRGERHEHDFYKTGEPATRALLAVEKFEGRIWECACGAGDMSRVLAEDHEVISTDLYDRGYGTPGWDFLQPEQVPEHYDNIVTNPPYKLLDEFVARALDLSPRKIAFIARLQWLEGQRRKRRFFDTRPPTRVWVFPYRIPMTRGDLETPRVGLVAFAWYVWEPGTTTTALGWLPRDPRGWP